MFHLLLPLHCVNSLANRLNILLCMYYKKCLVGPRSKFFLSLLDDVLADVESVSTYQHLIAHAEPQAGPTKLTSTVLACMHLRRQTDDTDSDGGCALSYECWQLSAPTNGGIERWKKRLEYPANRFYLPTHLVSEL